MRKHIIIFLFLSFVIVASAFSGPFGINFGMSLEQIRDISRTEPESIDGWHIITPPNTHALFEIYAIRTHPTYGVYFIRAISREISANPHGTELIGHFNNLVSNIARIYGDYLRRDRLTSDTVLSGSEFFMHTLSRGDRELIVFWHRDENSRLPDDIYEIVIYANARTSSRGYIVINYYSINFEKIEKEHFSVF